MYRPEQRIPPFRQSNLPQHLPAYMKAGPRWVTHFDLQRRNSDSHVEADWILCDKLTEEELIYCGFTTVLPFYAPCRPQGSSSSGRETTHPYARFSFRRLRLWIYFHTRGWYCMENRQLLYVRQRQHVNLPTVFKHFILLGSFPV